MTPQPTAGDLHLLVLLLLALHRSHARPPLHASAPPSDLHLAHNIRHQLGFHNSQPNANVSRDEYRRAYHEYMLNVRTRRQAERGERDNANERRKGAKVRLHSSLPLHAQTNATERLLHFPNALPSADPNERLLVKRATLFCSNHNAQHSVDLTRQVIRWAEEVRGGTSDLLLPACAVDARDPLLEVLWMRTLTKGSSRSRRSILGGRSSGKRLLLTDLEDGGNLVEVREKNRRKGKRKGKDCEKVRRKSCCRRSLKVSFEDLKIQDVILAPTHFDMGYCDGRCEARRLPYASNHAIFQAILWRNKGNGVAPRLCCAPTKLSELDIIQMDPHNSDQLKVTVIHNAKVDECGCA